MTSLRFFLCGARLGLVAAAAMILAACGAISREPPGPCPRVSIVSDASQLTQFRDGPGEDLIDILYNADITRIDMSCTYNRAGTEVDSTSSIRMLVARGPASNVTEATVSFFVAIVDENQVVIGRERFTSTFILQRSQRRSGVVEEIAQIIPMPPGLTGANYEILIGFELTDAQLAYNRRQQN